MDKQQNETIPESLRELSPRRDSFWDTVKFYVRLGNECAQRTTDRNIVVITVHPSGTFSCVYFLNEDAEALFPALLDGCYHSPILRGIKQHTQRGVSGVLPRL